MGEFGNDRHQLLLSSLILQLPELAEQEYRLQAALRGDTYRHARRDVLVGIPAAVAFIAAAIGIMTIIIRLATKLDSAMFAMLMIAMAITAIVGAFFASTVHQTWSTFCRTKKDGPLPRYRRTSEEVALLESVRGRYLLQLIALANWLDELLLVVHDRYELSREQRKFMTLQEERRLRCALDETREAVAEHLSHAEQVLTSPQNARHKPLGFQSVQLEAAKKLAEKLKAISPGACSKLTSNPPDLGTLEALEYQFCKVQATTYRIAPVLESQGAIEHSEEECENQAEYEAEAVEERDRRLTI